MTKLSVSFNNTGAIDYFNLYETSSSDRKVFFQIPTGYSYYDLDFDVPIKYQNTIVSSITFIGFGGFTGQCCLTIHGFIE